MEFMVHHQQKMVFFNLQKENPRPVNSGPPPKKGAKTRAQKIRAFSSPLTANWTAKKLMNTNVATITDILIITRVILVAGP